MTVAEFPNGSLAAEAIGPEVGKLKSNPPPDAPAAGAAEGCVLNADGLAKGSVPKASPPKGSLLGAAGDAFALGAGAGTEVASKGMAGITMSRVSGFACGRATGLLCGAGGCVWTGAAEVDFAGSFNCIEHFGHFTVDGLSKSFTASFV
ncbi:hypothetical protein LOC67_01540 [Stieleria sp. JC731]|uniref:hypothetical protein n=1 Tax=Pirellulaceae TaxID=2691357 RepID=UPI001E3AB5DD|nr:hypothetical protein [Stieleria sp. JC731]MCC9599225.1 hypothetical protein [Stieleria sp. JC731]